MKAVITGDIIQSTNLTSEMRDKLVLNLKDTLKLWDAEFNMQSELFRGDSFQCLLDPMEALRVALLFKTHIRSLNPSDMYDLQKRNQPAKKQVKVFTNLLFDVRIAVGIGDVDSVTTQLASSHGTAFTISGHLLDDMKNTRQTLNVSSDDDYVEELETEAVLLDAIMAKASALQCRVIKYKLLGHTETQIANTLNIGQSAVNQRSTAGNWHAIDTMLERFESIYANE